MKTKTLLLNVFFSFLILVPIVFLIRNIYWHGSMNWGDAPHFLPSEVNELVFEPLAWTQRGINFGGVNLLLWLSPLTILYGLLAKFFSLSSDLTSLIVFYLPGILFAVFGSYFLARSLKLSKLGSFFTCLVYLFNTYFLLLIDGGQVGVVLAYGIFPFSILATKRLTVKPNLHSFYLALTLLTFNSIADPRVATIAFLTIFAWILIAGEFKKLKSLGLLLVAFIALNLYWLFPLLKNTTGNVSLGVSNLQLTSILHPLFLFSPHWPGNLFGKVQQPFWYFAFLQILIFTGLIFTKKKKYFLIAFLFLLFSFFAKGNTPPLGDWYDLVVNLPFGFAFRDSSKFFLPVILFAGLLIGHTVEKLTRMFKIRNFSFIPSVVVYVYILFLIYPALLGKLNFILSDRNQSSDYLTISKNLDQQIDTFRAVWFPERHPLTFETNDQPALDAFTLVNSYPFAKMNTSEDWFNFLHHPDFVDWFRTLGIKYLILSDDPRTIKKDQKEQENWQTIDNLLAANKDLRKVDWGTEIPVYEVSNSKPIYPNYYFVDKIFAVVGQPLSTTLPTVYFEDGKWDPRLLEGKKPDSLKIYFNSLDKIDLTMSFLQKYFVSPGQNTSTQWSVFPTNQYLKAKYELLIRGVTYKDFDYQKGIAFSTKDGEEIKFELNIPEEGNYLLLVRMMTNKDSQGLENANTQNIFDTGTVKRDNFVWLSEELKDLKRGQQKVTIKNRGGLTVLNTLALIPKAEFAKAQTLSETFLTHFGVVNTKQLENETNKIIPAVMEKFGTLNYKFTTLEENHWLIMNENYHPFWQLRRGIEYFDSIPLYSMVNAFYVESTWGNTGIEFIGQKNVRWGMYLTVVFGLVLTIYYLLKKSNYEN